MSAAGFVNYDNKKNKFSLSPEQIAVFADDDSPASMMGAYDMLTGAIYNEEKVKEAFKTGDGVDYKDSCPICFQAWDKPMTRLRTRIFWKTNGIQTCSSSKHKTNMYFLETNDNLKVDSSLLIFDLLSLKALQDALSQEASRERCARF